MSETKPVKAWSEDELKELKALMQTMTWDQIGAHFKCSPDAARLKARVMGFRKHILNRADGRKDHLINSYSEEHGVAAAAKHYKKTKDEVVNARRRMKKRKEEAHEFLVSDHGKYRSLCIAFAYSKGFHRYAEDFASFCIVRLLEGNVRVKLEHQFAAYRIGIVGTIRSKNFEARRNLESSALLKEDGSEEITGIVPAAPTIAEYKDRRLFDIADKLKLKTLSRVTFLLHYKEGLTGLEIAEFLDCRPDEVSKMLIRVRKKIVQSPEAKRILRDED